MWQNLFIPSSHKMEWKLKYPLRLCCFFKKGKSNWDLMQQLYHRGSFYTVSQHLFRGVNNKNKYCNTSEKIAEPLLQWNLALNISSCCVNAGSKISKFNFFLKWKPTSTLLQIGLWNLNSAIYPITSTTLGSTLKKAIEWAIAVLSNT